jgi:hypothetical protein
MATTMAVNDSLPPVEFHHRKNTDGSVDAICLNCFMTAATAASLEELRKMELEHGNFCQSKKCPVWVNFVGEQIKKHS